MARLVRALHGPYRGILELPDDEAEKAIRDGWAADPNVPYEAPEDLDVEKAAAAADKALKKLRGEDEKPAGKSAKAMEAEEGGTGYQTRTAEATPSVEAKPSKKK